MTLRHTLGRLLRSVRFRLMVWALVVIAIILAAFSLFVYSRQSQDIYISEQVHLTKIMSDFQSYFKNAGLFYSETDGLLLPPGYIIALPPLPPPAPGEMRALVAPDGQVIWSDGYFVPGDLNKFLLAWEKTYLSGVPVTEPFQISIQNKDSSAVSGQHRSGFTFLATEFPTSNSGKGGSIVVGLASDIDQRLPSLALSLLVGSLAVLLVTLIGGYWIAGRIMRPVQSITRVARQISESDLRRRINLDSDDELGELASTFDQMLGRLEVAFDRQVQFTADASHELRTPLTIIELESERTLENPSTLEEYQRAMRVVRSENEVMIRLVEDLLILARLDTGKSNFKMEPLDLSDLVLEVIGRLAPLAESQNVRMTTGKLPSVKIFGDPDALARAFGNLAENAIKFTGGSQRSVVVETGVSEENGRRWGWMAVSDTGPGISATDLAHIFDRFYQIDKARTRGKLASFQKGSGLGLSIVQSIIKAHGGQVNITSAEGQGARFEVRLKLA